MMPSWSNRRSISPLAALLVLVAAGVFGFLSGDSPALAQGTLTNPTNVTAVSNAAGELTLTWEGGDNADSYLLIAVNLQDTADYKTATVLGDAAKAGTVAGLTSGGNHLVIVVALQTTEAGLETLYGTAGPVPVRSGASSPTTDRVALVALYNATGGANWTNRTNWLSNSPIGEWHGVTTNDGGRVTELRLQQNNLSGQIPAALGDLSSLEVLLLLDNGLTGPIPPALANLSNARILFLYQNQLTGQMPPSLGNLSNLEWFSVRDNLLSGEIPSWLGNLAELELLRLDGNQFTGRIPVALSRLSNLTFLVLAGNQLTGPIPSWLGDMGSLEQLVLSDNLLTGEIPGTLTNLPNLRLLYLRGNALTGCVPAALPGVATNDLDQLGLPNCGAPQAREFSTSQLETLFDEIISKTEQREAFSEVKESNIGFSAIEDMKKLRSEFVASRTETELYYALWKLSNARHDRHLGVGSVDGGLQAPRRASCVSAPLHVLPDLSDIHNPMFFVAGVGAGLTSPKVGDVIVDVNGRSMAEYRNEFTPWIRHSSLYGLYWRMAYELPKQVFSVPPRLYSGQLDLTLENSSDQRYDVSLPYSGVCQHFDLMARYPGFDEVMRRENFNVLLDRSRQMILLQWLDFEYSLIQDIVDLMEYAEREQILNYDMIIDVTHSSGGSRGAYAMQRLVDQPFRVTFGNVRLSDLGKARIERYVGREPNTDAPDIFGLNLSGSWLIDWARTDAMEAIRRGDEYTPSVPFKLAHLPKDSDGILQPDPVHFSGEVAIINARTWGGSHLDQFMAMYVDNDLATFIGMPTGGYSNTWEGDEVLVLPETGRPLVRFLWSIGHTIRPNGEVLEGNPALPDNYIPITRDNFQGYHQALFEAAIAALGP